METVNQFAKIQKWRSESTVSTNYYLSAHDQGRTQEFFKGGGWNFEKNILLLLKYRLPYLL